MLFDDEDIDFRRGLMELGFHIKDMDPDGHCLFRAIMIVLMERGYRDFESISTIRNAISVGMHTYKDYEYVKNYFNPDLKRRYDLKTEAREIATTSLWGNDLSVMIAALRWRINFLVFYPNMAWTQFPEEPFQNSGNPVYLSFHNGNHFNLLKPGPEIRYQLSTSRFSHDPRTTSKPSADFKLKKRKLNTPGSSDSNAHPNSSLNCEDEEESLRTLENDVSWKRRRRTDSAFRHNDQLLLFEEEPPDNDSKEQCQTKLASTHADSRNARMDVDAKNQGNPAKPSTVVNIMIPKLALRGNSTKTKCFTDDYQKQPESESKTNHTNELLDLFHYKKSLLLQETKPRKDQIPIPSSSDPSNPEGANTRKKYMQGCNIHTDLVNEENWIDHSEPLSECSSERSCTSHVSDEDYDEESDHSESVMSHDSSRKECGFGDCSEDYASETTSGENSQAAPEDVETFESSLECSVCGMTMPSSILMDYHRLIEHQRESKCQICLKSFSSCKEKNAHLYSVHGPTPFQCKVCSAQFKSDKVYKAHMKRHFEEYMCIFCDKLFNDRHDLIRHVRTQHKNKFMEVEDKAVKLIAGPAPNYTNPIGKTKVLYPSDMNESNDAAILRGKFGLEFKKCYKKETPHTCGICHKKFSTNEEKIFHLKDVHRSSKHFCRYCGRSFLNHDDLLKHESTHSGLTCRICRNTYVNKAELHRHLKAVHTANEYVYKKLRCGYRFKDDKVHFEHDQRQHEGLGRLRRIVDQQHDVLKNILLQGFKTKAEDLYKIHTMSRLIYNDYNNRRKVYVLAFVPPGTKDVKTYLSNPKNNVYYYVGKVAGPKIAHVSVHHLHQQKNRNLTLSTQMLSTLSNYDCYHIADYWLPETFPETCSSRQAELDLQEAKYIFKLFLFAHRFGREDIFFQELELEPLRHLTLEEIDEIVDEVERSEGNIFQLRDFDFQFERKYDIAKTNAEAFECLYCKRRDGLYTKVLTERHMAKCTSNHNQRCKWDTRGCLYSMGRPDAKRLYEYLHENGEPDENFICYTGIGLDEEYKDVSTCEEVLRLHEASSQSLEYYGQSSNGELSKYHFREGCPSSLKNMAANGLQLYQVFSWTCSTSRDMYRLETALIINSQIRRAVNNQRRRLMNKYIRTWDVAELFTFEEWKELCEYSTTNNLLVDPPPSFLVATRQEMCKNITEDAKPNVDD